MVFIDDIPLENLKISITERPAIPTPEQDVVLVEIKGRHGSLTKKYGYKDIDYSLEFNYLEDEIPFKPIYRQLKSVFFDGEKLSFADDPGISYKIKAITMNDAENEVAEYGRFTVDFKLSPFAYEKSTLQVITTKTNLDNQGYESEPYIKVHATGTGRLYINNQVVTIKDVNGFIELDSEIMNAYRDHDGYITNLNNHMVGDFPVLTPGKNSIHFDGGITKLEVNPRWRWL